MTSAECTYKAHRPDLQSENPTGSYYCKICGCLGFAVTTHCPGKDWAKKYQHSLEDIAVGALDYIGGSWQQLASPWSARYWSISKQENALPKVSGAYRTPTQGGV